jgi:hypothetical protein
MENLARQVYDAMGLADAPKRRLAMVCRLLSLPIKMVWSHPN